MTIAEICETLGISASSELAAVEIQMAKYDITIWRTVIIILVLVSGIVFPWTVWHIATSNRYDEELGDHLFTCLLILADFILGAIGVISIISDSASIIRWTSEPEAQAIVYILKLLGSGS